MRERAREFLFKIISESDALLRTLNKVEKWQQQKNDDIKRHKKIRKCIIRMEITN